MNPRKPSSGRLAIAKESPETTVQPLFFGCRAAVVTLKLIPGRSAWLVFHRSLVNAA